MQAGGVPIDNSAANGKATKANASFRTGNRGPFERKYHRVIRSAIDEQLSFTPEQETQNRKPLRQPAPFGATWELRCGPQNRFRVFYRVPADEAVVRITAIGVKERESVSFGGKVFLP